MGPRWTLFIAQFYVITSKLPNIHCCHHQLPHNLLPPSVASQTAATISCLTNCCYQKLPNTLLPPPVGAHTAASSSCHTHCCHQQLAHTLLPQGVAIYTAAANGCHTHTAATSGCHTHSHTPTHTLLSTVAVTHIPASLPPMIVIISNRFSSANLKWKFTFSLKHHCRAPVDGLFSGCLVNQSQCSKNTYSEMVTVSTGKLIFEWNLLTIVGRYYSVCCMRSFPLI